jgi:indolepyruvate ferredoxin oxidoreductase beta subunit
MSFAADPYNLIVCGVGGQGNILIARLIGRILADNGYYLAIGETFGAAQRGGSVFSSLRISKKRTYGPLIPQGGADLIVSLEPLETLRLLSVYGNEKVVTLSNTQTTMPVGVLAGRADYPEAAKLRRAIEDLSARALFTPATDIAVELGAPIVSNIVLLGALLGAKLLPISEEEVKRDMRSTFPPSKLELNYQALQRGMQTTA